MIKKEGNQQSLNINFKLKLIVKDRPKPKEIVNYAKGIYEQLKDSKRIHVVDYKKTNFDVKLFKEVLGQLYTNPTKDSNIKIHTTQVGLDAFNKALIEDQIKQIKKDEYRKRFSFESKIFKQTYKFR